MRALQAFIMIVFVATVVLTALWFAGAPVSCQEDMACWDCETMGNLICGGK